MKRLFLIFFALVLLTGCSKIESECNGVACNIEYEATYKTIEAKDIQDDFIIVDVRTIEEYKEGHIEGAINIEDYNDVDYSLDQVIVIYCRSGNRSKEFSENLISKGYLNVYDLGAITNWDGKIVKSLY